MKRRIADTLKRTARLLIKLANRLDGPTVTVYDRHWNQVPMPADVRMEQPGALDGARARMAEAARQTEAYGKR